MKDIKLLLILVLSSSLSCPSVFRTAHAQSPPPPVNNNYNISTTRITLLMFFACFISAMIFAAICNIFIRFYPHPPEAHSQPHAHSQPTRSRGIDPHVLATCPVISYSKTKAGASALQCSVCLAEFENGDALRVLPTCGHMFHKPCIDAWLAAHVTCPVCRGEVGVDMEGVARVRHVFGESEVRESEVKMLRSHSTGHSLEDLADSVVIRIKRSASYDVVLNECGKG